jgi:phage shock protein A
MTDTDLSGMDQEAARDYVLGFIKSLKETQRQKMGVLREKKRWQERLGLAEKEGRPDLAAEAGKRVEGFQKEADLLSREEAALLAKVDLLKENLRRLPENPDYGVDAQSLLAELQILAGERDETSEQIEELEAESRLEALKKKIEEEKDG